MGAKCVKSWNWSGNRRSLSPESALSPESSGDDGFGSRKIGVTHVVFKDGGKRTLEKVREAAGAVQCVGVGWVLDCERLNEWVDEKAYEVDTSAVPRGGGRRRKSMEPRMLSLDAMVNTPVKSQTQEQPATTKTARKSFGRRESAQWVRSPRSSLGSSNTSDISNPEEEYKTPKADQRRIDLDGDIEMVDWDMAELSPLPVTPAPEQIHEFAEHVLDGVEETPFVPQEQKLVTMTVPTKRVEERPEALKVPVEGQSSEAFMARLMAARRKSLQWAPKVGSPLARGFREL
jgi:hypothetical protein